MNTVWLYSLLSVALISLISFSGAIIMVLKQKVLKGVLLFMVSFAAGAMLGDVFLHLLPELAEGGYLNLGSSFLILMGIVLFFVLEKVVHWRHCHMSAAKDHHHPLATMNLIGDAMHNFIDGALIAGSFMLSVPVGIATTAAVIFHEIPQEMGDFGVLLHAGIKPKKALLLNFVTALSSVLGAVLILSLGDYINIPEVVIPITIGGFLYIANSDLIPELHKETKASKSLMQLLSFAVGVAIMFAMLFLPFHAHSEDDGHEHGEEVEVHLDIEHMEEVHLEVE